MDQVTRTGRESAKQRSRRIPLDYHRQPTDLEMGRRRWTWIAAALGGIYVAWVLLGWCLGWPQAARQFSPAPLADVHAAWSDDCAACHVPGVNLRSDSQAIATLTALLRPGEKTKQEIVDHQCRSCHAAGDHHANQIAAEVQSCASCHRDHRGRDAKLTRVADAECLACHRNLEQHRDDAKRSIAGGQPFASVASWQAHPEFRSLGGENQAEFTDPGRLKFNHALHMLPGQAPAGALARAQKTWDSIDPEEREHLLAGRNQPADGKQPVQLVCGSCHQPDGAPPGGGLGAYMQPIAFEQHCAACHRGELTVDADRPGGPPLGQVPHGLSAAELRPVVAGLLQPLAPAEPYSPAQPLVPIPGRTPGENLAQTIDLSLARRAAAAEARLTGEHRCGKCHEFSPASDPAAIPAVVPTAIPRVWLKHAWFDHGAHRAFTCDECHHVESPQPSSPSREARRPPLDGERPMIPGRETCAKCHGTTAMGGIRARHDCVECHRYHGDDQLTHIKSATP